MNDYHIWNIIDAAIPERAQPVLKPLRKTVVGHKIVNDMVMKYYHCEKVVKFLMVKEFKKKKKDITVFEMNIGNSRLDLGRINGCSYGYEIKTELDTLTKLSKQLEDYSKVLEYIYVVIHPKHLDKVRDIVPAHCGVITYKVRTGKVRTGKIHLEEEKAAELSPKLNTDSQMENLTSRDIEFILRKLGEKKIPSIRGERENLLRSFLPGVDFNMYYKTALKHKFKDRWEYLCKVFKEIQPIDAQAFFASPVDPYWVYYKNSSMV
ncbi:hypothetical protein DCCM_0210 [Desulfocucumis palustris]|uniref:Sce7726 family protein n=1 Tax=Desulfocucumis palustris TaxID=1898651 RepID=A0A2L2X763_9FIRM|nr:sce7726 family protein [Desulfocucumis palustris]GBF32019.1 hypothetical protein DCCM_0210 [Desulfocucumis palustris]